jgi:hypothetical protein
LSSSSSLPLVSPNVGAAANLVGVPSPLGGRGVQTLQAAKV